MLWETVLVLLFIVNCFVYLQAELLDGSCASGVNVPQVNNGVKSFGVLF